MATKHSKNPPSFVSQTENTVDFYYISTSAKPVFTNPIQSTDNAVFATSVIKGHAITEAHTSGNSLPDTRSDEYKSTPVHGCICGSYNRN